VQPQQREHRGEHDHHHSVERGGCRKLRLGSLDEVLGEHRCRERDEGHDGEKAEVQEEQWSVYALVETDQEVVVDPHHPDRQKADQVSSVRGPKVK